MTDTSRFNPVLNYLFWLCWSIIVGGMVLVAILAPVAFLQVPNYAADPLEAFRLSGVMLTLAFRIYMPICAGAFLILSLLEATKLRGDFSSQKTGALIQTSLLISGMLVWGYLGLVLVPQMSSIVMDTAPGERMATDVRQIFQEKHVVSTNLSKLGLALTLFVPVFRLLRSNVGARIKIS